MPPRAANGSGDGTSARCRRGGDEGSGRVNVTWETLARTIHFATPGRIAYAIFDASLYDIAGYERAICCDQPPRALCRR